MVGCLCQTFVGGYCSTVQGLLDWFEVDSGFTELSFIQIDLCVLRVFVLYSRVSLSSCPFLDILHCLPRAVGVPLESAINLVSRMSPCGAHDTHACFHICFHFHCFTLTSYLSLSRTHCLALSLFFARVPTTRGGGLGSRPKKMYGERVGDGVEYHSMSIRSVGLL